MVECSFENIVGQTSGDDRKIISFCGAGGKTSSIHAVRDYYLAKYRKVLVTTTTRMLLEEGCVSNAADIIEKLNKDGYAFAGIPQAGGKAGTKKWPVGSDGAKMKPDGNSGCRAMKSPGQSKISAIPSEDRLLAQAYADVTLIEADGARCLPFKVPKPWEPVIPEETTDIILVMGMDAERKRICDTCYNPEGVADAIGVSIETCLTREMMMEAYMKTYVPIISQKYKSSRLFLYMNDKIPGKTIVDCGLYIL